MFSEVPFECCARVALTHPKNKFEKACRGSAIWVNRGQTQRAIRFAKEVGMGKRSLFRVVVLAALASGTVGCTKSNPVYCGDDVPCPTGLFCSAEHVCAAGFSVDENGYYFDGKVYWSAIPDPVLTGTTNVPSAVIEVFAGDTKVAGPATVDGDVWTLPLPVGTIVENEPKMLRVVQTNDGTHLEVARTFAGDFAPPTAVIEPTDTLDETKDVIAFEGDGTPRHSHQLYKITLDGQGSKELPRYRHLMNIGASHAREEQPNPAAWAIKINTRVAYDKDGTRFRITNSVGAPVVDWAPIPATPMEGGFRFEVPINLETSEVFGTKSDTYTIEWEVTDWAKRQVKMAANWSIRLLPPPLQIGAYTIVTEGPRALASWRLSQNPPLPSIINGEAPVQMFERTFTNGVDMPVEVVVGLKDFENVQLVASAKSVDRRSEVPSEELCGNERCALVSLGALPAPTQRTSNAQLSWSMVAVAGTGEPLPCTPLSATAQKCTLPGRIGETPSVARMIATVAQIPDLNVTDGPVGQVIGATGRLTDEVSGCVRQKSERAGQQTFYTCTAEATLRRYRVISQAYLQVSGLAAPDFTMAVAVPGDVPAPQVFNGEFAPRFGAWFWDAGPLP